MTQTQPLSPLNTATVSTVNTHGEPSVYTPAPPKGGGGGDTGGPACGGSVDVFEASTVVNPFRVRLAQRRARRARQLGGKHRPSSYLDGRLAQAEEALVAIKRDTVLLRDEYTAPF